MEQLSERDPGVLSTNNSYHLAKVLQEDYAYITDTTLADYMKENCNYTVIPDTFDLFFAYALGFRKNSAYNAPFTKL